jgi:hypothetical protein
MWRFREFLARNSFLVRQGPQGPENPSREGGAAMKEMNNTSNYKGVSRMKKMLFVAALAAVLVVAFAASAFAYGPVYNGGTASPTDGYANYNTYKITSPAATWTTADGGGYLRWSLGEVYSDDNATSPHGNYATTTNKCAVCHAVHRADSAGTVLTAWNGTAGTGEMKATGSCLFCHGPSATFTNVRIVAEHNGPFTLSPHGRCQRCHTPSPHGAGASVYPVLAQKLFNKQADVAIGADIAAIPGDTNYNAMDITQFDLSDPAKVNEGVTLGTGYMCTYCHDNAADPVVFAVNKTEALPTIAGLGTGSPVTGHRVLAMATSTWNEDGAYGAFYSGTDYLNGLPTAAGNSTVAFNSVGGGTNGCKSCHDAKSNTGVIAFPHGYVNAAGAAAASADASAAAFIWMTEAGDSDDAKTAAVKGTGIATSDVGTRDGLCLKCHLNGDRSAGVGVTY